MQSRRFDYCIEFIICCHPLPSSMKTVAMLDKFEGCIALEARPCAECSVEPLIPDCGPPTTPSGKMEEPECREILGYRRSNGSTQERGRQRLFHA